MFHMLADSAFKFKKGPNYDCTQTEKTVIGGLGSTNRTLCCPSQNVTNAATTADGGNLVPPCIPDTLITTVVRES